MKVEAFDSLVQFLVEDIPFRETESFYPTPSIQERFDALAKAVLHETLTQQQKSEVELAIQLERLMQLAKARRVGLKRNNVPARQTIPTFNGALERRVHRCEYCLIHFDDVYFGIQKSPVVAPKHGGTEGLDNMAYCCAECRLRKGTHTASQTASGKTVALFDPRRQRWGAHFSIEGGTIEPLTRIGEATARLLELNDETRVMTRRTLANQKLYPRR